MDPITRPGMDPASLTVDAAAAEIADLDKRHKDRDESSGRYTRRQDDASADEESDDDASLEDDEDEDGDDDALLDDEDEDEDGDGEEEGGRLFDVIVDGEARKVPLDELIKGYGLQAALTQRGQRLAEDKRAFEAHATAVTAERRAYAALLGEVAKFLETQAPSEEVVNQLMLQDPAEGFRAKGVRDQILAKAGEFKQGFQTMVDGMLAKERNALAQEVAAAVKEIPNLIPEWRDAKRMLREREEVKAAMLTWGFTNEDLSQITDPRAMLVARKAWLYDRLLASRGDKLKPKSKETRTLPPGAKPNRNPGANRNAQALRDRARTSGSVDDVAAFIGATEKL